MQSGTVSNSLTRSAAPNSVARLSAGEFEFVTVCAVTLDSFTELAAQAQHLQAIGVRPERPAWTVSIDDLRVYADVFKNPLMFLHFIEQRSCASKSPDVRLYDELDHLGLYLKHNHYVSYAREIGAPPHMLWHGYRATIDEYFHKQMVDPDKSAQLQQAMPAVLRALLDRISATSRPGRRRVASMLLNCSSEWRNRIADFIDSCLSIPLEEYRTKPLSLVGEVPLTLFVWRNGGDVRDSEAARDHTTVVMCAADQPERTLVQAIFDASGMLQHVDFDRVQLRNISEKDLLRLRRLGTELKRKRVALARRDTRKIERNTLCPCGSGKKYKRCCIGEPE